MKTPEQLKEQSNFHYRLTRLHNEDTPPKDMALLLNKSLEEINSGLKLLGLWCGE